MAEQSEPLRRPVRPDPNLPWSIKKLFLWIEFCTVWVNYALHELAIFQIIENLGKLTFLFSIIAAAAAYILEAPDRAKQLQLQAYSMLATPTNGQAPAARADAFKVLHEAKLPLIGLNLSFIDLSEYKLANADLRSCILSDAILDADLRGVILSKSELYRTQFVKRVNLSAARLERCRLGDAQLEGAILNGANMTGANLGEDPDSQSLRYGAAMIKNASMVKAILKGADCSNVVFEGVDVSEADFTNAVLFGADLRLVKNLTQAQVESAVNIKRAMLPEHIDQGKAEEAIKKRHSG
jgi:uncharacterized protein YjbI with pentapeptide repeats